MGFSCGLVGLPNVGKSTLFNALTKLNVDASNYPFCTIEPNHGIVAVPDPRLLLLSDLSKSKKTIPAVVEFVDIAGLVSGASQGEGLGNQFLAHIRGCDAVVHVVRLFGDPKVEGSPNNPLKELKTIHIELVLADLLLCERQLEHLLKRKRRASSKTLEEQEEVLLRCKATLEAEQLLSEVGWDEDEIRFLKGVQFITLKPMLVVANLHERALGARKTSDDNHRLLEKACAERGLKLMALSATFEHGLQDLEPDEQKAFLDEVEQKAPALERLVRGGYELLNLITFFTTGEEETRAWVVPKGSKAPRAAGKIHSDFERKFIRAEVVSIDDFASHKSYATCREHGKLRIEGKNYVVQDGDICVFRTQV